MPGQVAACQAIGINFDRLFAATDLIHGGTHPPEGTPRNFLNMHLWIQRFSYLRIAKGFIPAEVLT